MHTYTMTGWETTTAICQLLWPQLYRNKLHSTVITHTMSNVTMDMQKSLQKV